MDFVLIGEVRDIQPIAIGGSVRELARLELLRYIGTKPTVSDGRNSS